MRVPTADETAVAVRRAQQALIELRQRRAAEEQHEADEQAEQNDDLARWNHDEQTDTKDHQSLLTSHDRDDAAEHPDGPTLELSPIN